MPKEPNEDVARYDMWHEAGTVKFYLEGYTPNMEECKFIFLKMIEQSVRDYISFSSSLEPDLIEICKEARDFIFDDDYYINWGGLEMNLTMILDMLDIDIIWFRNKTRKKLLERELEEEYE